MDFSTFLERLMVIITILGALGTAIGTFLTSRNQSQESDASVDRSKIFTPIDAAERISTISLGLSQSLQQQLTECILKRDMLIQEMGARSDKANISKVKLRRLVSKLRDIRERHDKFYSELNIPCPGYDVINGMIDDTISEIEKELEVD